MRKALYGVGGTAGKAVNTADEMVQEGIQKLLEKPYGAPIKWGFGKIAEAAKKYPEIAAIVNAPDEFTKAMGVGSAAILGGDEFAPTKEYLESENESLPVWDRSNHESMLDVSSGYAWLIATVGAGALAYGAKAMKYTRVAADGTKFSNGEKDFYGPDISTKFTKRPRPADSGFEGPNGYKTLGIQASPEDSPESLALINSYQAQGMLETDAIKKAAVLLESGSTLPKEVHIAAGEKLYKVIPEKGTVGGGSPYFATEAEIESLMNLSYDQITDRLGMPLLNQKTTRFEVFVVTAKKDTNIFQSVIAPTTQNGYNQPGGGIQSLITNRDEFSTPVTTNINLPRWEP